MAQTLDALRLGVVLANEDSRILHANRAAEEMMRDGGAIRDRGGVLRAEGGAAFVEIRSAIKQAAQDESGIGKTGLAVRLTEEDRLLRSIMCRVDAGPDARRDPPFPHLAEILVHVQRCT